MYNKIIKVKESQSLILEEGWKMVNLSDYIEEFIRQMFEEHDETIEIQRNELANKFNCAPSQINYVLTTRFTVPKGCNVESRRGGGGYIRIKRIELNNPDLFSWLIAQVGDSILENEAIDLIIRLYNKDLLTEKEVIIIKSAISDKTLRMDREDNNIVRANVLKMIFLNLMSYGFKEE